MIPEGRQYDLFEGPGIAPNQSESAIHGWMPIDPSSLSDAALIVALPNARVHDAPALAEEAGRRRLSGAVPALGALCRRLIGFGHGAAIPEQVAALRALATIGGREAGHLVARLITNDAVVGPNLLEAVAAAAALQVRLADPAAVRCLQHSDPAVRAYACRLVRPSATTSACLSDLLTDLHETVSAAAACALGRMGRSDARPWLLRLLANAPSAEAIDAFARVADDDGLVVLGRLAISQPALAADVLDALQESDLPRAAVVAAGVARHRA